VKFMQAAHHSGTQAAVSRIVVHATVSPCVRGGAVSVARYFQSAGAGGSAHYVVDPGEIVACLKETVVAWHAPPNTGSIGIELCDPQKGAAERWQDDDHQDMLRLAAGLVRRVAARWDVPLRRLTVAELRAGRRGICGHIDVSNAFRQTDHSDPGPGFPWAQFMAMVTDDAGPAPETATTWTEELVKDLPLLKLGADSFDVKTLRAVMFARGRVPEGAYQGEGDLKGWLERTKFDAELKELVRAAQRAEKLDDDGIVGPISWAALLRV
jgi:N-acetyl-anhydromuramyl-L-alanine amidase AmpD